MQRRDDDTQADPAAEMIDGLAAWTDTVEKARETRKAKASPRYRINPRGLAAFLIGCAVIALYTAAAALFLQ